MVIVETEISGYDKYRIDSLKRVYRYTKSNKVKYMKKFQNTDNREYVYLVDNDNKRSRVFVDRIYAVAFNKRSFQKPNARKYSNEFLKEVLEYKRTHTGSEVEARYNVNWQSILTCIQSRKSELGSRLTDSTSKKFTTAYIKKAIKYKEKHTWQETAEYMNCNVSYLRSMIREYKKQIAWYVFKSNLSL